MKALFLFSLAVGTALAQPGCPISTGNYHCPFYLEVGPDTPIHVLATSTPGIFKPTVSHYVPTIKPSIFNLTAFDLLLTNRSGSAFFFPPNPTGRKTRLRQVLFSNKYEKLGGTKIQWFENDWTECGDTIELIQASQTSRRPWEACLKDDPGHEYNNLFVRERIDGADREECKTVDLLLRPVGGLC